ncbi:hypothetical protein B0H14DRAFT_1674028 [Mycena olivaceomarginata]|nr:hypothetical protein B0H14DRAFT_1674028 [Mycena olivaceomarginata]
MCYAETWYIDIDAADGIRSPRRSLSATWLAGTTPPFLFFSFVLSSPLCTLAKYISKFPLVLSHLPGPWACWLVPDARGGRVNVCVRLQRLPRRLRLAIHLPGPRVHRWASESFQRVAAPACLGACVFVIRLLGMLTVRCVRGGVTSLMPLVRSFWGVVC